MSGNSEIHSSSEEKDKSGSTAEDWLLLWSDTTADEDTAEISPSMLFNSDSSPSAFWSGEFLPPPPRPPYLEDQISADGLTTCDLCTWALEKYSETDSNSAGFSFGLSNHLFVTLVVVSLLSAFLGAIVMIVLINCKGRINTSDSHKTFFNIGRRRAHSSSKLQVRNNELNIEGDFKTATTDKDAQNHTVRSRQSWLLLNRPRRTAPMQLRTTISSIPVTNHYTVEEAYSSINEAVYTELDRMQPTPSYQNSAYIAESDNDPISSAPSSAYYSDISAQDRGYETVGETPAHWAGMPHAEQHSVRKSSNQRLTAIRENAILHSNYI